MKPLNIVTLDGESLDAVDAADGVVVGSATDMNALFTRRAYRCEVGGLPVMTMNLVPESRAFGKLVATTPESLENAAFQYQQSRQASLRKLFALVAVVSSLVVLMLAVATIVLLKTPTAVNPLQERLAAYQRNEGTTAMRLLGRNLPRNRKELTAIRDDTSFTTLPAESQQFVNDRLYEFGAYTAYAKRFDPPTLSPREVRTLAELSELQRQLESDLMPPAMFATEWSETAAVKQYRTWTNDMQEIISASGFCTKRYLELSRTAVDLLIQPERGKPWRDSLTIFLQDASVPFWTLFASGSEWESELHEIARKINVVEQARENWEQSRARLISQRDLYDGMISLGEWLNRIAAKRKA